MVSLVLNHRIINFVKMKERFTTIDLFSVLQDLRERYMETDIIISLLAIVSRGESYYSVCVLVI